MKIRPGVLEKSSTKKKNNSKEKETEELPLEMEDLNN